MEPEVGKAKPGSQQAWIVNGHDAMLPYNPKPRRDSKTKAKSHKTEHHGKKVTIDSKEVTQSKKNVNPDKEEGKNEMRLHVEGTKMPPLSGSELRLGVIFDVDEDTHATKYSEGALTSQRYIDNYKSKLKQRGLKLEDLFGSPRRKKATDTEMESSNTLKDSQTTPRAKVQNANRAVDQNEINLEILKTNQKIKSRTVDYSNKLKEYHLPPMDGGREPTATRPVMDILRANEFEKALDRQVGKILDVYDQIPGWNGGRKDKKLGTLVEPDYLEYMLNTHHPMRMENCYNYYL